MRALEPMLGSLAPRPLRSIWAECADDPGCHVLLAAHGEGAPLLWRDGVRWERPGGGGGGGGVPQLGAPVSLLVDDLEGLQVGGWGGALCSRPAESCAPA